MSDGAAGGSREAPVYLASAAALRAWFAAHAASERELWLGFHKRATGRPSPTWSESVDEALCVGWIDGVRRRVDDARYVIRFTPRKPVSIWSAVNVARVAELEAAGRMRDAGRAAFAARRADRTAVYSHESPAELPAELAARFRAEAPAWAFFEAQAPSYRRMAAHWVASAKRAETRERRLAALIADSAAGRRVDALAPYPRRRG